MRFLIDSDYIIEVLRGKNQIWPSIDGLLENSKIHVSDISILEIYFGFASMDDRREKSKQKKTLHRILKYVTLVDIKDIETIYAKVRKKLYLSRLEIGAHDMILASQALHFNLTLITNNLRHFDRVEGLKVLQWTKEKVPFL